MPLLRIIALVILLCLPAAGHALRPDQPFRDYNQQSWSAEQGLPQNAVSAIAQDRRGYLWVG